RAHEVAFGETKELELGALAPLGGSDWLSYVAGVAWALAEDGLQFPGLDAVVDGDVPIGAGLSSSASLELAAARAFAAAGGPPGQRLQRPALRVRGRGGRPQGPRPRDPRPARRQRGAARARRAPPRSHRAEAGAPRGAREPAAAGDGRHPARGGPRPGGPPDERLPREPPRPVRGLLRRARPAHRPRPRPAGLLRGAHDRRGLRRLRGGPRPGGRGRGLRFGRARRLSREGRPEGGLVRLPAHGGGAAPRLNTRRKPWCRSTSC